LEPESARQLLRIPGEVEKMKRKQLLINEKDFNDLKRIWRGGLFRLCSDSLFIRALIEHELTREMKK
jgi:hypothetical protein